MGKIKTYFKDYAVAQKACNEFNKKHWFGSIILSAMIGLVFVGGFVVADKIRERNDKKSIEKALHQEDLNVDDKEGA